MTKYKNIENKSEIIKWLHSWFKTNTNRDKTTELGETVNFFEGVDLDSMEVLQLIEDVEKEFSIYFNQEEFQDPRFSYISGLADLINTKLND